MVTGFCVVPATHGRSITTCTAWQETKISGPEGIAASPGNKKSRLMITDDY
jgi:hypothetical protein